MQILKPVGHDKEARVVCMYYDRVCHGPEEHFSGCICIKGTFLGFILLLCVC